MFWYNDGMTGVGGEGNLRAHKDRCVLLSRPDFMAEWDHELNVSREADKVRLCESKGVTLIHVWEDSWDDEFDNIRVRDEIARTIEARRSSAALSEERTK